MDWQLAAVYAILALALVCAALYFGRRLGAFRRGESRCATCDADCPLRGAKPRKTGGTCPSCGGEKSQKCTRYVPKKHI